MKTNELLKLLKKNGCSLIRHGSNHDIWYSSVTEKHFAVPRHKKEIKSGTAAAILRDSGINTQKGDSYV